MRTFFYVFSALVLVVPMSAVGAARALLPQSQCEVSQAQMFAVKLEISYSDVKAVLGCDGVRHLGFHIEGLTSETYSWRGTAWPYATFTGHFYNGVLHGIDQVVLSLDFDWETPGQETAIK